MTRCEVIPAPEPVSMAVVVGWSRGMWMPDQVQHDGVWGHTSLRAGIHGGGSGVVQWPMDAGSVRHDMVWGYLSLACLSVYRLPSSISQLTSAA